MFATLFKDESQRTLEKYDELVRQINDLEQQVCDLTDVELREQTSILRTNLQAGLKSKEQILVKSFALVREATNRVLGIKHFDVQLVGGLILNEGKIAEMKTGEGKTLVALLPAFFNALYGKGVHIVTVNDYLARRDAAKVGSVLEFLGLSVGLIQENMDSIERKQNYSCDIVYVTNNELGFDYLRDNMALTSDEIVQRPFFYCIVDEVDSILIDEARTPLIISGTSTASTQKYLDTTKLVNKIRKDIHYVVDEKNQNVTLLNEGISFCEQALGITDLYSSTDPWIPFILNSIKAKELFIRNTHYIVNSENEIIIVDEFTGRTMIGRRWSDGLHQAVEAKENLPIQDESQTLASITYQNLFLLYDKLSGMTGTAKTEELEFEKIYNLLVIPVPTNRTIKRKDFPDLIYKNQYLKWQAIATECREMYTLGRPVLVGTTTIEKSELLAALLTEYQLPYQLLNARPENIAGESEIIAQAGCTQTITIATNMAGRGTDIVLGGTTEFTISLIFQKFFRNESLVDTCTDDEIRLFSNLFNDVPETVTNYEQAIDYLKFSKLTNELTNFEKVYDILYKNRETLTQTNRTSIQQRGGLHVIGTERHESRRIDNQLRGRAGRQGDPGSSRFFLSLEDKLLRIFGGEKISDMLQNFGFQESEPIQSTFLNQSLESAQKKVESYYFDIRKKLFEYDQALNTQRNGIYGERKRILETISLRNYIFEYAERTLSDVAYIIEAQETNIDKMATIQKVQLLLGLPFDIRINISNREQLTVFLQQQFQVTYSLKEAELNLIEPGLIREVERSFLLQQIDFSWKEHLQKIASLRDVIGWRAYGQKDPLVEYKQEAYNYFITMLARIRHRVTYFMLRSQFVSEL